MFNITRIVRNGKNVKPINKGVMASGLEQILSSTGPFGFLDLRTLFLKNCKLELVKIRR